MKVAIYCRLSAEDRIKQNEDDDSQSIQNQKSMLINYAIERGWDIYKIYSDDNYTGSDRNRPEFNNLLDDAKNRKFEIILCKTQSRFTRELELVEKYIHGLFPLWGIRFVSVVDNADSSNKGNKKARQINGLINEWYLEDMSENIKSVLTNKRKNGDHIGAFALYGYKKDPDKKGHLIIDEEAAAVVREVFTLFSQGYGKTAIARLLNDRGIPNPTEYKRLKGLRYKEAPSKHNTLWQYFAISNMLHNEMYIGNMIQGRYGSVSYKTKQNKPRPKDQWYIVEGTHEPIIDTELWERVQDLLKQKAKPFVIGQIGLFARKAKCANCGYTMRAIKSKGKHYLRCSRRYFSKDDCIGSFISVDKLEGIVLAELHRLTDEYLNEDEAYQQLEFTNTLSHKKEKILKDISTYNKKINDFSKGLRDLYMDKVKGLISEFDYLEMSKDFTNDREHYTNLVNELEKQLSSIDEQMAKGDTKKELFLKYRNLDHLTREMVEILIDYIVVNKRIPGTNNTPVEIHWKF